MRKLYPLLVVLFTCTVVANAQQTRSQAREAEWKNYALPQTNFARQLSPEKEILFRIPADWKEDVPGTFVGPHSAKIILQVNKIPDGYPFQQYFTTVLKGIRDLPGGADGTVTRKTQFQDLEAREIFLDLPDEEGELQRRVLWLTTAGPLAIAFHFHVPAAHAAATEPYFKAVVQSVIFLSIDYAGFEALRTAAIKTPAPGPIHEVESIVATLNGANVNREAAINRLTSLFSSHPDVVVDLLLDRRPLVRAAAVRALAQSNNSALAPLLWNMVDDQELIVAEAAARSVASSPDIVAKTLQNSFGGVRIEIIARVWPFLAKEKRHELLQKMFSETAVAPPPPKPAAKNVEQHKVEIIVADIEPVKPGQPVADVIVTESKNPIVQRGALTLLSSMPAEEFKLPLARLMASKYDSLIGLGLEVANDRGESLPVESLFKLVASTDKQVSKLAAQSLGFSAAVADIPKIEALISKDSARKALNDELQASIKKIRFRHELNAAKSAAESREIIRKALSDSSMADFAWQYDCENTTAGCAPGNTSLKNDFAVKPFGENLFPKRVKHYTAIPKPGQAVQKFYESLNGLQMETPRAQANLILMMGFLRQQMLRSASAPIDAETLIEYTGIDPNSPIAATAWTAEGALDSTNGAERKAIVIRVRDRARFERTIEQFQDTFGAFPELTDYLAMGTRGMAALPAILPFSLQAVPSFDPSKISSRPVLTYDFSRDQEWNGVRIKTIEHRTVHSDWTFSNATTHIAFVGDTAILTSDVASLRELLNNAASDNHLSGNEAFSKTAQLSGDIVYFSDVEAVMAETAATTKNAEFKISESGSLNIAGPSWENTHQLFFKESDWAKPLLPFDPKELVAPRELLPASTIAYYLMKVDPVSFWNSPLRTSFISNEQLAKVKLWSMDFEKDVLPELGPECGAVLLELPDMELNGATWAVFCNLKSSKLAPALGTGKELAEVKFEDTPAFVAVRNGFLILSNRSNGIAAFDGKSNLATTRDYSRAVKKAPSGIVAFGGYNLEAAIAAATKKPLEGTQAEVAKVLTSIASAFHSQSFYATATAGSIEARSSVAMDREGRYPVADFSYLPRGTNITFVTLDPSGVPITDQKRLSSLTLKIRAKAAGPIDNIKDDVKTADQSVEQKSPNELLVTVAARRSDPEKALELPIKDPQFAEYLKATTGIEADNAAIMEQARQIAGNDRDAWSVARKLADWTYQNLEWKQVANASAEDTLATREADCSEFSQLFIAMARSLGLPARMVSGLAYSGNSFGGHAWVEVYVGKWIELDPTWGTHFVDATHIRNNSDTLTTSAALNLIELEVLETKRTVADFQKSPKALMQHLVKAMPAGNKSDLEATLDLAVLSDQLMGEGAWAKMSEAEREQMWSAYRRLLVEIISGYSNNIFAQAKMRVLHIEEKENVANAVCVLSPLLYLKLQLVRRNDVWYLAEIVQGDTAFRTVYETLRPAIASIEKTRSGDKTTAAVVSDYVRVILLLDKNPEKAVKAADAALKVSPGDQRLRYLKAIALQDLERDDEGEKVLRELANENLPAAMYRLADHLNEAEEETKVKEAIMLYERYSALEPYDSRVFLDLALAYKKVKDPVKAEAAYRKIVELNPEDSSGYVELIVFLSVQDKLSEVGAVLAAYDKNKDSDDDVFGESFMSLFFAEEPRAAEKLATAEPVRFKASATANLYLGRMYFDEKKYAASLNSLNIAAQLDPKSPDPHITMAQVHRKQSRWAAALKAAQQAITLDEEDSEGHYQRACALARMGRLREALASLEKAIELDPDRVLYIEDEADLKPLAALPAFKKFIPKADEPN